MQRIRKGDEVIVIAGKDKGKKGVVLSRVDDRHVTVEGVNVAKKHVRPNPMTGAEGGVVDKVMPIDQSNVCSSIRPPARANALASRKSTARRSVSLRAMVPLSAPRPN